MGIQPRIRIIEDMPAPPRPVVYPERDYLCALCRWRPVPIGAPVWCRYFKRQPIGWCQHGHRLITAVQEHSATKYRRQVREAEEAANGAAQQPPV
jgi:hypothetical protein